MSCCLEQAIVDTLRGLDGTPISSDNHFIISRKCGDCLPYMTVKSSKTAGLRTTSGVQTITTVEINGYFSDASEATMLEYRDMMDAWAFVSGCISLGACGCFCSQNSARSQVTAVAGGLLRYTLTLRGDYKRDETGSGSG